MADEGFELRVLSPGTLLLAPPLVTHATWASLLLGFIRNFAKSEISAHFVPTVHQALQVPHLI